MQTTTDHWARRRNTALWVVPRVALLTVLSCACNPGNQQAQPCTGEDREICNTNFTYTEDVAFDTLSQSFIPAVFYEIKSVKIYLDNCPFEPDVTLKIQDQPTDFGATVIQSKTITAEGWAWNTFDFSSDLMTYSPGVTYYLLVTSTASPPCKWSRTAVNQYGNGDAYINGFVEADSDFAFVVRSKGCD